MTQIMPRLRDHSAIATEHGSQVVAAISAAITGTATEHGGQHCQLPPLYCQFFFARCRDAHFKNSVAWESYSGTYNIEALQSRKYASVALKYTRMKYPHGIGASRGPYTNPTPTHN